MNTPPRSQRRLGRAIAGTVVALTITTGCGGPASTFDVPTTDLAPVEILVEEHVGVEHD